MGMPVPEMIDTESTDTSAGCPLDTDLSQVMTIIVDEFKGDTVAFFQSIRDRRKTHAEEDLKDAIEAAATRKLAKIS